MIIQNFDEVGRTETRKDALEIINAGIEAVLTKPAMKKFVTLQDNILNIKGQEFDLSEFKDIYVIGGGKAGGDMAEALEEILGDRIKDGIVITTQEKELKRIKVVQGTHPNPSKKNQQACDRILETAERAGEEDLLLTVISGGGSALMANPRTHTFHEDLKMNQELLTSGADIYEINAVRKHLSKFKGGQLSEVAYPTTLVTMIISDVLGNDLSVIASGPTVKDESTVEDAKEVIEKYNLPELHPEDFKETPKDDKWFSKTHNILLLTNEDSVNAMKEKAGELGYETEILGYEIEGEAREVGKDLAQQIEAGTAKIGAGETTVTVTGDGKGGRNQEVALGALGSFDNPGVVASAGTDGIDNTEAAGAVSDQNSKRRATERGLNHNRYLENNDAFNFFQKINDLIMTGETGTNVADIMLALGED